MSDDGDRDRWVERLIFLKWLNVARPLGSASQQLARVMRDRLFPAGSVIYRRGDAATHLFWVMRGDVEMTREGAEPWTLVPPSIVGILDIMQDRPRDRTATALTDVEALSIGVEDYLEMMEDNFEYARSFLRGISGNIHQLCLDLAPTGGFVEPEGLPAPVLPRPLNLVERTLVLHEAMVFRSASMQGVSRLASLAEEVRFSEGDVISRRGEPSHAIPVVARGLVQATRDVPRMEARFGTGSLIGGYASVAENVHEYDATALTPTSVLHVRKDDLFDLLEDHFEMTRSILGFLASERERMLEARDARIKAGENIPVRTAFYVRPLPPVPGTSTGR